MDDQLKEVYFWEYCPTCKHKKKSGTEEPCNECLENLSNVNSHRPIKWEGKKKK